MFHRPKIPRTRPRQSFGMVSGWLRDDPGAFCPRKLKLWPFTHISLGPHPGIAYDNRHTLLTTSLAHCLSQIPAHHPYIIRTLPFLLYKEWTGVLFCEKDTGPRMVRRTLFSRCFPLAPWVVDGRTNGRKASLCREKGDFSWKKPWKALWFSAKSLHLQL